MAKYLIEWGTQDRPLICDVIEADSLEEALSQADWWADDWWNSNKVATAEPFKDKNGQTRNDTVSCRGVLHHVDAAGRDLGGDGQVKP